MPVSTQEDVYISCNTTWERRATIVIHHNTTIVIHHNTLTTNEVLFLVRCFESSPCIHPVH